MRVRCGNCFRGKCGSRATFAHRSCGAVINGGVVVASWARECRPLVVRGKLKGRNLAELNMFPRWVDDGAVLMANALELVACRDQQVRNTNANTE